MTKYNRYPKKYVAHTQHDRRYTSANQMNNASLKCINDTPIRVTQTRVNGKIQFTITCKCGHRVVGDKHGCKEALDFVGVFYDTHPQ